MPTTRLRRGASAPPGWGGARRPWPKPLSRRHVDGTAGISARETLARAAANATDEAVMKRGTVPPTSTDQRPPRRRLSPGARAALVVIALVTSFAIFAYQDHLAGRAAVGRPAPGFALLDQSGRTVRLSTLRGQVVVLNFWASWCTVCTAEAPVLEAFAQRYAGPVGPGGAGAVRLLGIDWREPEAVVRAYVREHRLTYPNLRDGDGSVAQRYGLTGVPETWFIGPRGIARIHILGAVTFAQLQEDYRAVTARPIDGAGIGPVPDGRRAHALAWNGPTLWIASSAGLASSSNGGRSWRPAGPAALGRGPVSFVQAAGSTLWAGGPAAGLWQSKDGGRIWHKVALPGGASVRSLAFAADSADFAEAWVWVSGPGKGHGLWFTSDGGTQWRAVAAALPASPQALAAGLTGLWAATAVGVYRSGNDGRVWAPAGLVQALTPGNELASPVAVLTTTQPLVPRGIAAVGSRAFFAGPTGIWGWQSGHGAQLVRSPSRAFAGVAPGPGGRLWAIAPNGDLYVRAGDGDWVWRPFPLGWALFGTGRRA